jgi:hypothetical protein
MLVHGRPPVLNPAVCAIMEHFLLSYVQPVVLFAMLVHGHLFLQQQHPLLVPIVIKEPGQL